jgi:hypothetical protein
LLGIALALGCVNAAYAADCLQKVIGGLYADLETIDNAGEARLAEALEKLSQQERWSEAERNTFTLTLADDPRVDAVESQRTEILSRIFSLAQRGEQHCAEVQSLHAEALELERAQWDAAVEQINQRIWR